MMRIAAAVTCVLVFAGCGDDGSSEPAYGARKAEAEQAARRAEEIARANTRENQELKVQVDALIAEMDALDQERAMAEAELVAAKGQERDAAAAKIASIRARQLEAQARIDRVKSGVKLKCPPDKPLC